MSSNNCSFVGQSDTDALEENTALADGSAIRRDAAFSIEVVARCIMLFLWQ